MNMQLLYQIIIRNEEEKIVNDTKKVLSHSYVIQFLELIETFFESLDKNATDVNGVESVLNDVSDLCNTKGRTGAAAGDATYGIVVGTNDGATPEDNENYALDTKILHSAIGAAGCFNYQAVTFVAPTIVGANVDFDITRTFLNETGVTITVKEIGIICKNTTDTKYHLLLRDVVADKAVLDGYTLTVVYTLRTTV